MVPSVPLPGDIVADKYEILELLGKGGMGVVVEAKHRKLGIRVAIKFLMPDALGSHDGVLRFEREARASALLRSPHVVRVVDIDKTTEGLPFIVMEYLEGHDLGSEIRQRGTIPLEQAIDWILQACIGLAEAHARGIVHRDIKPANLYLCTEPTGRIVKVMDFGVSKLLGETGEVDLTTTETTVGTPSYMAPEQLLSSKAIDHRADIWALGVVLYRMLAGSLPFVATSPTALAIAIATSPPVHLATVAPGLPPPVIAVVMRALEKNANDRHADIVAFGRALEPFGSKRVAFDAAIARLPRAAAASTERMAPAAFAAVDDVNPRTESAWAQKPHPSAAVSRRASWLPLVIGLLALAACGVAVLVALRLRRVRPATIGSVPVTDVSAGAFAAPPPAPEPAEWPTPNPTAAPAVSSMASGASAHPSRPGRAAPRPSSSTSTSTSKPARPTGSAPAPDDPLHL